MVMYGPELSDSRRVGAVMLDNWLQTTCSHRSACWSWACLPYVVPCALITLCCSEVSATSTKLASSFVGKLLRVFVDLYSEGAEGPSCWMTGVGSNPLAKARPGAIKRGLVSRCVDFPCRRCTFDATTLSSLPTKPSAINCKYTLGCCLNFTVVG